MNQLKNFVLLGYDAAGIGNSLPSLRDNLSGRFLTVKMGPIGCSEISRKFYHSSLRNNPEERSSHLLHSGSLKSRNLRLFRACSTFQALARIIIILRPF
jgi:hypothetical protein